MTDVATFDLRSAPLDKGTVLLEASAGTGKTYALVGLLLRLVVERRIARLEQALVVTFTVAATEELKTRLYAGLERVVRAADGDEPDAFFRELAARDGARELARAALDDFDRVQVATIHGFCKRLLDEAAFESHQPFLVDFVVDPLPLLQRAAADALRACYEQEPGPRSAVIQRAGITPEMLVQWHRLWRRFPGVVLEPADPDPEAWLARLPALLETAAGHFDDRAQRCVVRMTWKSRKCPFLGTVVAGVASLQDRLRRAPMTALSLLAELAPSRLAETLTAKSGRADPEHPFFAACDELAAVADRATAHLRSALLRAMDDRLSAEKRREHVLSFDDLLLRTHEALHDPARADILLRAIRSRFDVALIDEFQDTDSLQYEVFARCFAGRPLFLVGDPKQSIYGFRGADLRSYLAASQDAAAQYTLDTNYRSSAALVAAVSRLFAAAGAFVEPRIRMPVVHARASGDALGIDGDPGAALQWRVLPSPAGRPVPRGIAEPRIAADVTAEIARLLAGGASIAGRPLLPRDFAILTRTNRQAILLQDHLRAAGIASAIGKAGDIFETQELDELDRLVRAVLQPGNPMLLRAAMSTRPWGMTARELADSVADDRRLAEGHQMLSDLRRTWLRAGFVVMAEELLARLDAVPRLLSLRGGERSLTNFRQLIELLHHAELDNRLTPEGLLEWLQHERRHKDEVDYQLRELRLESDEDAVQILTVHGSKGLEYEVVFCPFLADARAPKPPAIVPAGPAREFAFTLSPEEAAAVDLERLAEDLRLCYVALTRAKRRCYVHVGLIGHNQANSNRSALAWLLAPPAPGADPLDADGQKEWRDAAKCWLGALPGSLEPLVAQSEGTMSLATVPEAPTAAARAPAAPAPVGEPRRAERRVFARGLHSFSSLVAGALPVDAAPDVADPPAEAPLEAPAQGIFAFARGARAGVCLHSILEHVDLTAPDDPAAQALVRRTLAEHGLDRPAAHQGPIDPVADVLQNLRDLAAARATDGGPTVAELTAGAKVAEWKFTLPAPGSHLADLAPLFAALGSPVARRYAATLAQRPSRPVAGFLTGFVDLIACHEGRHWILDWKSNHLGDRRGDYDSARLEQAMLASDYVLQYHLYVLALHRQLRARLPGYDYERSMGGVLYAFVRGAAPGEVSGMFSDRVPYALVAALDRWAGGTP